LEARFHTPLKKKYGICSVVVLDSDHVTVINPDAEADIQKTHCDTGKDFPWKPAVAMNLCEAASMMVFCTIM
jgi:hypothetical protein